MSWKRTLYITFTAQLLSAMGFSMIFPFLPFYIQELGSSSGFGSLEFWVAMVFSAQALTMMIASPIWGALADRYGRKIMVERAMFGGAILIFMMAFARSAEELTLLRAIQGLVTGVGASGSALVAAVTPRKQTGYAMGVLQVGLWSGVAVGPVLGGLITDFVSVEAAFMVTAVLCLLGGLLVAFGIKEEFRQPENPGRLNLLGNWKRVFSAPGVAPVFLIRFMAWLGRNVLTPFAPLFIATLMTNQALVGTMTGLMIGLASAAGTASALYLGRLGDRVGHKWVLTVSSVVAAVFYLPQSFVTAAWQLLVLQALTGAAIGGIMPSLSALLSHFTQRGEEGAVYGLDNAIVAGARAAAPSLGAVVVAATMALAPALGLEADLWRYRGIFLVTSVLFLVTAVLAGRRLPGRGRSAPEDRSQEGRAAEDRAARSPGD
ncbi:MAG TPA: MFS transporter [Trueperaceae bacterium]